MTDRGAAERACKDPNPIIDGRKANVNLAYLGAKPRSIQTGEKHASCKIIKVKTDHLISEKSLKTVQIYTIILKNPQ